MPKSVAKLNKEIRRDALREELRNKQYLSRIHKILDTEHEDSYVPQARMKLDGYFKLLAKTLPDVKATELTGEEGGPIKVDHSITVSFRK